MQRDQLALGGRFVAGLANIGLRQPAALGRNVARGWRPAGSPLESRRPWWPLGMEEFIAGRLEPGSRVFEFGAGGSTLWLEDQKAVVLSVEHDAGWHGALTKATTTAEVELIQPAERGSIAGWGTPLFFDEYVGRIDRETEPFDLIIVDGRARVACLARAMTHVRPGGMLLLDDSQRRRYRGGRDLMSRWEEVAVTGAKPGREVATTRVWIRPPA